MTKQIGGSVHEIVVKVDEYARGMISGSRSTLFEELGLTLDQSMVTIWMT
jgi:hypothetical protein